MYKRILSKITVLVLSSIVMAGISAQEPVSDTEKQPQLIAQRVVRDNKINNRVDKKNNAANTTVKKQKDTTETSGTSGQPPKPDTDVNRQIDSFSNDSYVGLIGFRPMLGFYNFRSEYTNQTGSSDVFRLPTPATFNFVGGELSVRMGPDRQAFQNKEKGFAYYTTNRGMFADVEVGFKRFLFSPGCIEHNDKLYIYRYNPIGEAYTNQDYNQENCKPDGKTNIGGNVDANKTATLDGVSAEVRQKTEDIAANVNLFYLNSYYHMTWINWLLNGFTSEFNWFDLSLGPSFRFASYSDYGDPTRAMGLDDDNSFATIAAVARLYLQFGPYVRLRGHFYYPFYAQLARLVFKTDNFNQDEMTLDGAVDIMLLKNLDIGVYFTVGYEAHIWLINQNSGERFNQGRAGLVMQERISGEFYLGLGFEGYFNN